MRAMAVAIIDHRRQKAQTRDVEFEINQGWIGDTTADDCKPMWVHAAAKNNRIGGVSIAVHPALKRYAHTKILDDRGWSRWVGIELAGKTLNGRTGKIALIATYGPTPSDGDQSMWDMQDAQMAHMPISEQQQDPRWQYMHDMANLIEEYKQEGVEVILVGDTNINHHKNSEEQQWWAERMAQLEMINWMEHKWPQLATELHRTGCKY